MEPDFVKFFRSLKETAAELGLHFSPDYIMMDSNDPTYNAAEKEFLSIQSSKRFKLV